MNNDNQTDPYDTLVRNMQRDVSDMPDPQLREKMQKALGQFKQDLEFHPYVLAKDNPSSVFSRIRGHKFLISQVAAAVVVLAGGLIFLFALGDTATYAQVNERFMSVPYFRATIYLQEGFADAPQKIELWMDNGRSRALTSNQVIFGRDGRIDDAFDIVRNVPAVPDDSAANIIQRIGSARTFSLETLLNCVSLDNVHDSAFSAAPCRLAQELTVFDKQTAAGDEESIRIWALQKSRLPVQVRIESRQIRVDILLAYSEQHSDLFFDAKAFAEKNSQSRYAPEELAYLFYHAAPDSPDK
ncbi:MAG: hypothetical protein JXB18_01915 [Sedimentisphaerales bacterium]|nr:hypothetical protein [Sedimentisphaerales bacterium]